MACLRTDHAPADAALREAIAALELLGKAVFTAIQQGDPDAAQTAMATLMTAADHRVRRSR